MKYRDNILWCPQQGPSEAGGQYKWTMPLHLSFSHWWQKNKSRLDVWLLINARQIKSKQFCHFYDACRLSYQRSSAVCVFLLRQLLCSRPLLCQSFIFFCCFVILLHQWSAHLDQWLCPCQENQRATTLYHRRSNDTLCVVTKIGWPTGGVVEGYDLD